MKVHHTEIELPVKFADMHQNHILSATAPLHISVFVEGKGIDIYHLKKMDNYIEVDASDFNVSENEVHLTEHNLVLEDPAYRTSVDFIINKNVHFQVDVIARKKVDVEKRFLTLEDELHFQQLNVTLSPEQVEIEGPAQELQKIDRITTTPLSKDIIEETVRVVELEIPEHVIGIRPDAVEVLLEDAHLIRRTIPMVPISYPDDRDIMIIPQYVTVKVEGRTDLIRNLRPGMINAYVDIPPSYENNFADVNFRLPDGISLLEYTPRRVQIIKVDS